MSSSERFWPTLECEVIHTYWSFGDSKTGMLESDGLRDGEKHVIYKARA